MITLFPHVLSSSPFDKPKFLAIKHETESFILNLTFVVERLRTAWFKGKRQELPYLSVCL